jgi:hypothetical protein
MAHTHRDHESAQKLYELIKDVKICPSLTGSRPQLVRRIESRRKR